MPGHFSESNRISAEASSTLGWRRSSNKRSKTPARYSGNLQRLSQEKCYATHSFDRGDSGHCGPDAIPAGNRQAIERTRLGFAAPAEHAIPRRTRIDRHLCLCGKRLLFLPDSTRRGGGAPLRRGRRLGAQNQDQSGNGSGSAKLKELLKIAGKVQKGGKSVLAEDIEQARQLGATDLEIHDTDNPDMYRAQGARLAREGYVNSTKGVAAGSHA